MVAELQLVDGVWKRLFRRVDQEIKHKESKDYLERQTPAWEKVLLLKKDPQEQTLLD
jgi:hypothetical protein